MVKDGGIGLSSEDLKKIFRPYFKSSDAKNSEINKQSSGLGLYVSKKISR